MFNIILNAKGEILISCPKCGSTDVNLITTIKGKVNRIECSKCGKALDKPIKKIHNGQMSIDDLGE